MAVVTSITVVPGSASPVHVSVQDQAGDPIPPGDITWALDAALAGVTVTPDATGFNFSAPTGTGDETGPAVATYTPNGVTGSLGITVQIVVSALQFVSP